MINANDSFKIPPSRLLALGPKAINTKTTTQGTINRAFRCVTEAFRALYGDYPEITNKQEAIAAKKYARENKPKYYAAAYAAADAAADADAAAAYAYAADAAAYAYAADAAAYAAAYAADAAAYAAANAAYAAEGKKALGDFCIKMIEEFCAKETA